MGLKIFCLFILGIFACSKVNQWKQPTQVCFDLNIEEETIMDGSLSFKQGYLMIESFKFDGKRMQGADVYFTKYYEQVLNTSFGENNIEDLTFDVPQGNYKEIKLEIVSETKDENPNLVIHGFYKDKSGKSYPVCFELDKMETFTIVGKDLVENAEHIDLVQTAKTKASILLNPTRWFEGLTKSTLEKAEKVSVEGKTTILINNTINQQLYDNIVASLESEETVKAIFEKQS